MADTKRFTASIVEEPRTEGGKSFWREVATGFEHKDGKGLDLLIPAGLSITGRIVIREASERPEQQPGTKQAARPSR